MTTSAPGAPATAPEDPGFAGGVPRFFGLFAAIHELELPGTEVDPLYQGFYSGFYDLITDAETYDLPHYLARAQELGSPVLELACGSGRIAIPLARAGAAVTAVDLAPDMLRGLRRRMLREPPEVAARVTPVLADIRELDLEASHRLAIIGATSVCLLREHADRVAAFRAIAASLAPEGRLCFDFLDTNPDALRAQDAEVIPLTVRTRGGARLTLMGRRWLPDEGAQMVNFYSEDVDALGRTRRYLGSTTKAIVTEAQLREQLGEAGLAVEAVEAIRRIGEGSDAEIVRLVTCRRG